MLFSQACIGLGSLSPWIALMSLQNDNGLLAIPVLVPLRAAVEAPCGMLCLQYGVQSRKGPWRSVGTCTEEGSRSALSPGHIPQ